MKKTRYLSLMLFSAMYSPLVLGEIQIPKQADWSDHGVVLTQGAPGSWEIRLGGMISPCSVVKKNRFSWIPDAKKPILPDS